MNTIIETLGELNKMDYFLFLILLFFVILATVLKNQKWEFRHIINGSALMLMLLAGFLILGYQGMSSANRSSWEYDRWIIKGMLACQIIITISDFLRKRKNTKWLLVTAYRILNRKRLKPDNRQHDDKHHVA